MRGQMKGNPRTWFTLHPDRRRPYHNVRVVLRKFAISDKTVESLLVRKNETYEYWVLPAF